MRLSIITINYNDKHGLEKTIQSVCAQTFGDYEYIVIDGGSTDGSKEVLEKYASRITKRVSEKDGGIYNAMNKGVALASGEYLQFLNSGDTLSEASVLENFFSKPLTLDVVTGNVMMKGEKNFLAENPDTIDAVHLYESTVLHPCSFIKKDLFTKYGNYNESYRIVSDYEFFVRVFIKHNASYEHREITVSDFDTTGVSNQQIVKLKEERERVLKAYFTPLQLSALKELFEIRTSAQYNLLKWMNKYWLLRMPLKVMTRVYVKLSKRNGLR